MLKADCYLERARPLPFDDGGDGAALLRGRDDFTSSTGALGLAFDGGRTEGIVAPMRNSPESASMRGGGV